MSRAGVPGGDGAGADEASPPDEDVHVHQQGPPRGLPPVLPGHGAARRLLWHHQDPEEEGGVPLHRRQLVLRGDGDLLGVRLLQVPFVTAPQLVQFVPQNTTLPRPPAAAAAILRVLHVDEALRFPPRWSAPPLCDFVFCFFPHTYFDCHQFVAKRKPQTKMGHVWVFRQRENIL